MRSTTRPVHDPATGWRRLVRAVALGGACYGLAIAAHLTGGGGWPGWPVTLMLTGLLGVMSVALTSRRRRTPFVLLVLTAVQTLLHLLFAQVDGAAASCAVIAGGHHHVTTACAPSVAHAAETLPSLPMAAAHIVATVVTAWLWPAVRPGCGGRSTASCAGPCLGSAPTSPRSSASAASRRCRA